MHFADEYFVRAQDQVLHHSQHAVHDWFATLDAEIKRRVARLTDDDVLGLDDPAWSRQLASELEVAAPVLDTAAAEVVDEGTVTVDCAGAPGITFSSMEWGGAVLRDGNRMPWSFPELGRCPSWPRASRMAVWGDA
jgi:hypothetical protein